MKIVQNIDLRGLTTTTNTRGDDSECRVASALRALQTHGEIEHWHRSHPRGELDHQGIDFQIFPKRSWCINLQVKSSDSGKKHHRRSTERNIPCIVVRDEFDDRQLLAELRRIIGNTIEEIQRRN